MYFKLYYAAKVVRFMRKKNICKLFALLNSFLIFFSCQKEQRSSIPSCEVYIETSPSEYVKLLTPNSAVSYIYTPGMSVPTNFRFGYGGVLIYRDLDGKIRSCDLACPVEASRTVRVDVRMPRAVCPVCRSEFDLSWGFAAPVAGPAKETLRVYDNVRLKTNSIVVVN